MSGGDGEEAGGGKREDRGNEETPLEPGPAVAMGLSVPAVPWQAPGMHRMHRVSFVGFALRSEFGQDRSVGLAARVLKGSLNSGSWCRLTEGRGTVVSAEQGASPSAVDTAPLLVVPPVIDQSLTSRELTDC